MCTAQKVEIMGCFDYKLFVCVCVGVKTLIAEFPNRLSGEKCVGSVSGFFPALVVDSTEDAKC